MKNDNDAKWMRQALKSAEKGLGTTSPNPMVGAVIVSDGKEIGRGWHVRPGENHAEINALHSVSSDPKGATMYVTLEPCSTYGRTPPCTKAIIEAGIGRVVIASVDPNPAHAGRGVQILRKHGIQVDTRIEKERCDLLNEAFFKWIVRKRPFVLLKMAMTLDGRIATESGSSRWITADMARKRVQKLRLWADAVMGGAETYRLDSPAFTARTSSGKVLKTPRRIVVSRHPERLTLKDGWETVSLQTSRQWEEYLEKLGGESVTSLLIEGGGELAASALEAGIVDKVEFHIAPKILGGKTCRPVVGGSRNPLSIGEAYNLKNTRMKQLGVDFMISGYLSERNG